MVVLTAAVVTGGKTLVARQFLEMTRLRVDGLLGAFQQLVGVGRGHTFIETETVRYVYTPMGSLQLVLVSNKLSNILEDLETLRLLAKVVQDCCQVAVNEENVLKNALDIVFAFDEVVSIGHRGSVTLSEVKTYCEMDSHEEKIHQMIEQSKINEAREVAKKKAIQISKNLKAPVSEGIGPDTGSSSISTLFQDSMPSIIQESPAPWTPSMSENPIATIRPKTVPKKSMMLSKKDPTDVEEEALSGPVENALLESVKVEIKERVTAELVVDGGLNGDAICNGSFEVAVHDTAKADLVCFKLSPLHRDFKFKTHPSLNRASQLQNILEVRQGQKSFPAGGCLKWQLKTSDDAFLPVTLGCWPTATGDGIQVVLELELTDNRATVEDVEISFPVSASSKPVITGPGTAACTDGQVTWFIPVFGAKEGCGTLEFTASVDVASLLPATLRAVQKRTTRCPMDILECYHQERREAIDFVCEKTVMYELKMVK